MESETADFYLESGISNLFPQSQMVAKVQVEVPQGGTSGKGSCAYADVVVGYRSLFRVDEYKIFFLV